MAKGKRIDAEMRDAIVRSHCNGAASTEIAKHFGISYQAVTRIVRENSEVVAGTVPDSTPEWMEHITPLHKHKQELERTIERKQAELDKARQEYRDFLATLKQLMEDMA